MNLTNQEIAPRTKKICIGKLNQIRTSPAYDAYWYFAGERQKIFYSRIRNPELEKWSEDEILNNFKFTNAYRASDRVSQYLIKNVIYSDNYEKNESNVFFRIMLFKLFNKIETWELLEKRIGVLTYESFDFKRYDQVLTNAIEQKERIYSAAYIMPSGKTSFGYPKKHRNHLTLLEALIKNETYKRIIYSSNMEEGYKVLLSCPTLGPFLAYQLITDINYSELTDFSEREFVMPGPGALDGISKCFINKGGFSESELIKYVCDHQEKEFEKRNIDFKNLWSRPLQLIDCQNLFCEISKYTRVSHPQIEGLANRKKIKQKFQANRTVIDYWYPPKWGINERIYFV